MSVLRDVPGFRDGRGTLCHGGKASGVEGAAAGDGDGAGQVALKDDAFRLPCGVWQGDGGEESLGIGAVSYTHLATAFAYSIKTFSNPAFAGIIFAFATMIIAATMATMMLATGTIITNVYKNDINPNVDDAKLLKLSKIITFVFAYLTLIPAVIMPSAALTNLFLTLQHVAAAPVSFAILVGLTWKRCTRQGAFWAMASGMVVGVAWMLLGLTDTLEAVYPTVLVSYTVGVVVSLATSKKMHGLAKE